MTKPFFEDFIYHMLTAVNITGDRKRCHVAKQQVMNFCTQLQFKEIEPDILKKHATL